MTFSDAMISSASRPLRLRMRPDLTAAKHRYLGRTYWVVKEPVALKYFRFQEEEYAILNMLDGCHSLDDIKLQFESRFRPQKITLQDLHQYVAQLHRGGLVISESPQQGRSLYQRSLEVRRRKMMEMASSILALRFKGFDPEWFLNRTYPYVRWLFHPLTVMLCLCLVLAAASLVVVRFSTFQSSLPAFYEFFGPKNWLLLAMVLGLTKVLHEFGHGYSCKHFGGECHEIGVMFLVLTPCLYCNVSDSWLLRNKWHRAAIGAAGMYVEVVFASIATFIWWFTEPGLLNHLALQVMFVSSVSTLLFNGNPLLRYDGYYILSDILEIPNLRQKASQVLQRMMAYWCLGIELPDSPFLPQRNRALFALYTVASSIYRWVVMLSIMLFLNKVFEPYGLKIIGQLLMLGGLFGLVVMPIVQLTKFLYVPGRMDQVKRKNVLATAGVVAAILAFVLFVPLPHRLTCPVEIRPTHSEVVFVKVPGQLDEILIQPGKSVEAGTPLVRLVNYELDMSIADLQGKREQRRVQLEGLRRQRVDDSLAGRQIPAVEQSLAAIEQQILEKEQDRQSLLIQAPIAGVVIPPPSRPEQSPSDGQLPQWTGTSLDRKNEGAFLDESVPVCEIADAAHAQAALVVDQGEVEFLREGQKVRIRLDAYTGETLYGEISKISAMEMRDTPQALSNQAGGSLPTETDENGMQRPLSTSYLAQVELDDPNQRLLAGMRGRAKVSTPWQTLGQRIARFAVRTFRFDL